MLQGHCLCGSCGWTLKGNPQSVTVCNCSACRRYGVVWAYGIEGREIALTGAAPRAWARPGAAELDYLFCGTCGCCLSWRALEEGPEGRRIAVNLRLADDPAAVRDEKLHHFDGAVSFDDVEPEDVRIARHLRDLWF